MQTLCGARGTGPEGQLWPGCGHARAQAPALPGAAGSHQGGGGAQMCERRGPHPPPRHPAETPSGTRGALEMGAVAVKGGPESHGEGAVDRMFQPLLSSLSQHRPFSNRQTPMHPSKPSLVGPLRLVLWPGRPSSLPLPCPYRPTSSSSRSPARGRSRLQTSMVKRVLLLLKMDVSEDMSAAIITATISPRRPGGTTRGRYDPAWAPGPRQPSCPGPSG